MCATLDTNFFATNKEAAETMNGKVSENNFGPVILPNYDFWEVVFNNKCQVIGEKILQEIKREAITTRKKKEQITFIPKDDAYQSSYTSNANICPSVMGPRNEDKTITPTMIEKRERRYAVGVLSYVRSTTISGTTQDSQAIYKKKKRFYRSLLRSDGILDISPEVWKAMSHWNRINGSVLAHWGGAVLSISDYIIPPLLTASKRSNLAEWIFKYHCLD